MAALVAVFSPAGAEESSAGERPNVLLILADDIGYECYGHSGSTHYRTPHLDRLAREGVRFTQAHSNPLCTPSRVKILTGRYNVRNYRAFGEVDLAEPTFATMLRARGYRTAVAGKWQLSPANLQGPHAAGFDEYCLWHFMGRNAEERREERFRSRGSRYKSPRLYRDGELVEGTEGEYGPDEVTDFLCDFIRRSKDRPFLAYYPMILTHDPFEPSPRHADWELSKYPAKKRQEYFRDMVRHMDECVGRLIACLEETGVRDRTLVIVTGDNGTHRSIVSPFLGGEVRGGKGLTTDAGTHVGFVASWPGRIAPGTVIDAPIDFADVLPTLAEVTGARPPEAVDGESWWPVVQGRSEGRGWVFVSYTRDGPAAAPFRCFVRDRRWKLYSDGEVFDVASDPLEESPTSGEEAEAARRRLQPILEGILARSPDARVERPASKSDRRGDSAPGESR